MPISEMSEPELWKLADQLQRDFHQRDRLYDNRDKVLFRRMDGELRQLPLNPMIGDKALMVHQTEVPQQEMLNRSKRLNANPPELEIVLQSIDPALQEIAQKMEDGLKALLRWMSKGKTPAHEKVTKYQQGAGIGLLKIVMVPGHGHTLAGFDLDKISGPETEDDADEVMEARKKFLKVIGEIKGADDEEKELKAFDEVTEDQLRTEDPPFRMLAVPARVCYWWEDDNNKIDVILEVGKKSLNPLLENLAEYGVVLQNGRLVVKGDGGDAVGGITTSGGTFRGTASRTAPDGLSGRDLSREVLYLEIRTRHEIVILIEHPKITIATRRSLSKGESRGIIMRFPNPFGPYTTGYSLVPGDETTSADPALQYQPTIEPQLNTAQPFNVLATARLSSALEAALAPNYIQVDADSEPILPQNTAEEDKVAETKDGQTLPQVPGQIRRVESPKVDQDKAEQALLAEEIPYRFRDVLAGEAKSEDSGHKLALQVSQADTQMTPYQTTRADAIEEMLMGILYAIRRHQLTVYIPTIPDSLRGDEEIRSVEPAFLSPEMADLQFSLIVKLGSETAISKYAKWAALSRREAEGTLGYQTLIENSDVDNPSDEIKRIFEGKLLKALMEQTLPFAAEQIFLIVKQNIAKLANAAALSEGEEEGGGGGLPPDGPPPGSGFAGGGGEAGQGDAPRVPGRGLPPEGPPAPTRDTGVAGIAGEGG